MKLADAHLQHFKRFTDLTIRGLGPEVRLVMIAGPNGSGKSSLFDAFLVWARMRYGGWGGDSGYYQKGSESDAHVQQRVSLQFHGPEPEGEAVGRAWYFRSAYRNDPEFQLQALQRQGSILEERRFAE
jgi:predicted ATPase